MNRWRAPGLCLVTDRRRLAPDARTLADELDALRAWLDAAIAAGLDLIHLRERDLDARRLEALARWTVARAEGSRALVLVNDRADVALAAGAAGVHLRSDGPPVDRVRTIGPAGWIVGRSIHSAGEAVRARDADYLLFGTVFASRSKPGQPGQGLGGLRDAAAAVTTPVWAIGGVTLANARSCLEAGASGVAAIDAWLPRTPGASVHETLAATAAALRDRLGAGFGDLLQ